MKSQTLPVKRRPVPKGIFRRLSAVTRRQRVAAATMSPSDMDADDGGSKISRALTIIFLIHVVAIGLIFFHRHFLDGRPAQPGLPIKVVATAGAPAAVTPAAETPAAPVQAHADPQHFSSGEKPYIVKAGDNFQRIAAAEGVDESDLRRINRHANITPGLILKIPPKRVASAAPKEVAVPNDKPAANSEKGLVEAVDVSNAPKAKVLKTTQAESSTPDSGSSYVVQAGDSIWRIANRFKISQDALMKANGISDARKIKVGTKLTIPQS